MGHEFPDDTAFILRPSMANELYLAAPGPYIFDVDERPEVVTRATSDTVFQTVV